MRESGVYEASEAQDIVIPPRSSPPPDVIVAATAASGPTPSTSTSPQDITQQKKQKQKQSSMLSDEDEESMLEFLQANTFMYNMKSNDYKDNVLRAQVWQTQADKMGLDVIKKYFQLSLMYTM